MQNALYGNAERHKDIADACDPYGGDDRGSNGVAARRLTRHTEQPGEGDGKALEQHGDRGGNDDRIQNAVLYAGFHPPPVPQTVVERQDRYDRIGNAESGEQRKLHDFIVDPETALQKIGSFFYSDRTENFRHAEHHHGEQSLHERGGYAYL